MRAAVHARHPDATVRTVLPLRQRLLSDRLPAWIDAAEDALAPRPDRSGEPLG